MSGWRMGKAGRQALIAAAVAVLTLAPMADASAASRLCRQLEAQLAAATDGGGTRNSGQARKYDRAIGRQRNQIAIARGQARGQGCGFAVFGRNVRQCAALNATIDRMERNLSTLERTRGQMDGGGTRSGRSRARILASLDANGCRAADDSQEAAIQRPREEVGVGKRRRGLLDQLFASTVRRVEPEPEQNLTRLDPETGEPIPRVKRVLNDDGDGVGASGPEQTYTTMCVRTCDGYFFPMSPSSTVTDFDRDEKNCESSCPGADIEIFYRPAGSPEETEMTSATTGRPYSQLSTAYLYKNTTEPRPATCGCNVARNFQVVAGTPPTQTIGREPDSTAALPQTAPLPEAGPVQESPSITLLPPATPPVAEKPAAPVVTDGLREIDRSAAQAGRQAERKVRVVGPAFLPDQGAAIDLRAPARTEVR